MHSRFTHYGGYVVCWSLVPPVILASIAGLIYLFRRSSSEAAGGLFNPAVVLPVCAVLGLAGMAVALFRIQPSLPARNTVETTIRRTLFVAATITIMVTVGIVAAILFEAIEFFTGDAEAGRPPVSVIQFLTGTVWAPEAAFLHSAGRDGESAAQLQFGSVPIFAGTFMITLISLLVAVPIGLFSAIYMAEYSPFKFRQTAKPILEILAGIPTVVYGFFAIVTIAPVIVAIASFCGVENPSYQNALTCGLVMGIMIIPLVSSLSDDVITSVPQSLREGSLALGTTRAETIKNVILPAATPGIISAILLAISRAIGETMIVVMAASQRANLTANPLEDMTTVTVKIVSALTGDKAFDSAETLSAFALGLVLLVLTLGLNIAATIVIRRFRKKYSM